MNRTGMALAACACLAVGSASPAEDAPTIRPAWRFGQEDGDAAPQYLAVFKTIRDWPDGRQGRLLPRPEGMDADPPDAGDQAALAEVIHALRVGAAFRDCGWPEMDTSSVEAWSAVILPWLRDTRSCARFSSTYIRHYAPSDEDAVAVGLANLAMGRSAARFGMVGGLVGIAVRAIAYSNLAERAVLLPRAWLPELAAAVALATEDRPSLTVAIFRSEARVALMNLQPLKGEGDAAARVRAVIPEEMRERAPRRFRDDPAYWEAQIRELALWHLAIANAYREGGLPAALARTTDGTAGHNLPVKNMETSTARALRTLHGEAAYRALFLAGLACLAEPDETKWAALPAMRDPGRVDPPGPFAVERVDGGFVLTGRGDPEMKRPPSLRFAPPALPPKPEPIPPGLGPVNRPIETAPPAPQDVEVF